VTFQGYGSTAISTPSMTCTGNIRGTGKL
jgi:hypothetical protein